METKYDVICFGEILLDLFDSGPRPGGAPMNVCFHLNQLGLSCALISRLSEDSGGNQLLDFLENHYIPHHFIQKDDHYATGTVQVKLDERGIAHYNIVSPVAWDFISPDEAMLTMVRTTPVFIYGSLAARNEVSRDTLMRCLDEVAYKVMDVNLRAPHYDIEILDILVKKASLLKLNEEELDFLVGATYIDWKKEDKIRQVAEKYQLSSIVVTLGERGAIYFEADEMYLQDAFRVEIKDTVGSGDGFLAAFLHSMHSGRLPQDCLRIACAYGALVAAQSGATPTINKHSLLSLISDTLG